MTTLAKFALAAVLLLLALIVGGQATAAKAGAWRAERDAALAHSDSTAAERDAAVAFAAAMQAQRDSAVANADRAYARANREKARADRLASQRSALPPLPATATSADSLARYQELLTLADGEIGALRLALTASEDRAANLQQAVMRLDSAVTRLTTQLAAERANATRLARQLATASAPCRILFFPCPSRTVVAIGSFVLGAAGGAAIAR